MGNCCFAGGGQRIAVFAGAFDPVTDAHLMVIAEVLHLHDFDQVWVVPYTPVGSNRAPAASLLHRWMMMQMAVSSSFGSRFPVIVLDNFILEDVELGLPIDAPPTDNSKIREIKVPSKPLSNGTRTSDDRLEYVELENPSLASIEYSETRQGFTRDHFLHFLETISKITNPFPEHDFHVIIGSNKVEDIRKAYPDFDEPCILDWKFVVAPRLTFPMTLPLPSNFTMLGRGQSTKPVPKGANSPQPSRFLSVCFKNSHGEYRDPYQHISTNLTTHQVRHRLRSQGVDSVEGLIPPVVLAHIIRNELYVNGSDVREAPLKVSSSIGSNLSTL